MIVVADTGPLNYLVLIDVVNILEPLYKRVLIPSAVADELRADGAPLAVRRWIAQPPDWLEILLDPPADKTLSGLDPGESAAIAMAVSQQADRLLIDDSKGRAEAERRHLKVTGTLGVIAAAHRRGLLDFEAAIASLSSTTLYLSPRLLETVRRLM
jgi:predicted nucleic acid-binding protein